MTAHELAKLLLAGPDLLVVTEVDDILFGSAPDEVTTVETTTVYQRDYGHGWGDMHFHPAKNRALPQRALEAVKLR